MLKFVKDLREALVEMKRCGNIDPIALAAFAHKKIGEIHPFVDGNGRIARGLMNVILMQFGINPVIFTNDAEYTAAVEKDMRHPGYFTKYLRTDAIPKMSMMSEFLDTRASSSRVLPALCAIFSILAIGFWMSHFINSRRSLAM